MKHNVSMIETELRLNKRRNNNTSFLFILKAKFAKLGTNRRQDKINT